jgi:hypothetical protein
VACGLRRRKVTSAGRNNGFEYSSEYKCFRIEVSPNRGRVAQLGEQLLCKTQGKSHKCRIWCRLRGKRTVQPTS